ncbi:MAG: hypothetical protein IPK73_23295 [Candidatus Obscuribacter sp.]|nr:hypothetical protein [Candidatus Obscuribacter sp.]MBK9277039.1 hypothetical protein [Candidatus Obscuribacter sp.]
MTNQTGVPAMPIPAPGITERADYYALERAARHGNMLPEIAAANLDQALGIREHELHKYVNADITAQY